MFRKRVSSGSPYEPTDEIEANG